MSLTSDVSKAQYVGNGITVAFNVSFPWLDNAEIFATLTTAGVDAALVIGADFTLTGVGNPAGGTLTMLVAPAVGARLTIKRQIDYQQLTTYVANDAFPSTAHEAALDKLTKFCQQLQEQVDRCIKFPDGESAASNANLPGSVARANLALKFDVNGNLIVA